MPAAKRRQLTRAEVAELVGISPDTWSAYVTREQAPVPDGHLGRTPWWWSTTIERWQAKRKGPGWHGSHDRPAPKA